MSARFVIADGAKSAFGPRMVASGGRVLVYVGVIEDARTAAHALQLAREQWPHLPLATLHVIREEEIDATE